MDEEGGYNFEGRKEEEDGKIVLHKLTHYIYVPCFDSFCCVLNFLIKWKKTLVFVSSDHVVAFHDRTLITFCMHYMISCLWLTDKIP